MIKNILPASALLIMMLPGPMVVAAEDTADSSLDPATLLASMANHLRTLKSFSVHTEKVFDDVLADGAKVQYSGAADISVRRPDRIHIDYGDDISAKELWYDGRKITLTDHKHNVYMQVEAAPTIAETLTQLEQDYGLFIPLTSLLREQASEEYQADVERRRYMGLHDVEGRPCHHLLFEGETVDWQVWIQADTEPLLRKIVVTYKEIPGSPQQATVITDWIVDVVLDEDLFTAKLPSGAVRAEPMKVNLGEQ